MMLSFVPGMDACGINMHWSKDGIFHNVKRLRTEVKHDTRNSGAAGQRPDVHLQGFPWAIKVGNCPILIVLFSKSGIFFLYLLLYLSYSEALATIIC